MLRLKVLVVLVVLAVAAVAGCVSEEAAAPAAQRSSAAPPPPAPDPVVTETLASIQGRIVDDEQRPVIGARVFLREVSGLQESDAAGNFTFNGLEGGVYTLVVERIGFETLTQKVIAEIGQVTTVKVVMKPIPIPEDAYFRVYPRTYYIEVDHDYINFYAPNVTPLWTLRCNPCFYVIHIERNTTGVLSEAMWPPSGNAVVNTQAYNDFYKGFTDQAKGTRACFIAFVNRGAVPWTDACQKSAASETKLIAYINGGFTSISFQQRINVWTTFAYKGQIPDGYTQLPPP